MSSSTPPESEVPQRSVSQMRSLFEGANSKNGSPIVVPSSPRRADPSVDGNPASLKPTKTPAASTSDVHSSLKRAPPPPPPGSTAPRTGPSSPSKLSPVTLTPNSTGSGSAPPVPSRPGNKLAAPTTPPSRNADPFNAITPPSFEQTTPVSSNPDGQADALAEIAAPIPRSRSPAPPVPRRAALHPADANDQASSQTSLSGASSRKVPAPPPPKRPSSSSRSPSPQPASPSNGPELPPRLPKPSLPVSPSPRLPSRPLRNIAGGRIVSSPITAEDTASTFTSTSTASSLSKVSISSMSTAPDDASEVVSPLLGDRRTSMPVTLLHHEQLDGHPYMNMERAATDNSVALQSATPTPPALPSRAGVVLRPSVPPKPPARGPNLPSRSRPPSTSISPVPPTLPPRATDVASGDDLTSSQIVNVTAPTPVAPLLPPRTRNPEVVMSAPATPGLGSAPPPPSHPEVGQPSGRLPLHHSHSHHSASLSHAVHKIKATLPLIAHGPLSKSAMERPKSSSSASSAIRSHTLLPPANPTKTGAADAKIEGVNGDPKAALPPPPVRTVALGAIPPPRRNASNMQSPADYGDDDAASGSSSAAEDADDGAPASSSKPPIHGASPFPSRSRTMDDMPDSSRSSRKAPFAPLASKDGTVLSIPAPPKSVYALGAGILCIGRHEVQVYDLSSYPTQNWDDPVLRGRHHYVQNKHRFRRDSLSDDVDAASHHTPSKPRHVIVLRNLNALQWRVDSPTVTAMEYAPRRQEAGGEYSSEIGRYLWCGTKDGHLFEVDTLTGEVTTTRSAPHRGAVTHILRHRGDMVTIDETGKTLLFGHLDGSPTASAQVGEEREEGWTDVRSTGSLMDTPPLVLRIADKQNFASILYGKLWTSAGSAALAVDSGLNSREGGIDKKSASSDAGTRGPMIRVYDIFTPANTPVREDSEASSLASSLGPPKAGGGMSRTPLLLPTEPGVGAVTSATVLSAKPNIVYIGHEGGFVTIWDVSAWAKGDGSMITQPNLVQTMKISASDVMCLEGVHSRLWAGSRNGLINAYDIESRPWKVTNTWKHGGYAHSADNLEDAKVVLPVLKLITDVVNVQKTGSLLVMSIGRDELIRFWDGYLSSNWIDSELRKREETYSTFRPVKVLITTWNVDASKPDALNNTKGANEGVDNMGFLNNVLTSVDQPDIIVFGFQELIDLESRKLTAKTVLLGSNNAHKVSRSYNLWYDRLVYAVRVAMPPDCPYTVVHTENLVGLFSCIFVRSSEKESLREVAINTVKRGMGGHYGNKGAIVSRFIIEDSSFSFINCHLAAGQSHKTARNQDVAAVLEEKTVFPETSKADDAIVFAGGGDGSMILDHEFVFLNGDLNYRIDQRRDAVISNIKAGDLQYLLNHDQLLKEMKNNRGFRLRTFLEPAITFAPTYKYDRFSNNYDSSEKRRVPAWCDRILYRCRDPARVQPLHYKRYEVNVSDHRPVSAAFTVSAKRVNYDTMRLVEQEIHVAWLNLLKDLVEETTRFYIQLGVI